jgi:hypothetical protein
MNQRLKNKIVFIPGIVLIALSPFAFGADAMHGQTLAATYCSGCHTHLPSGASSADRIANAINGGVGAMSGLQALLGNNNALSPANLADIAAYAGGGASTPSPTPTPTPTPPSSSGGSGTTTTNQGNPHAHAHMHTRGAHHAGHSGNAAGAGNIGAGNAGGGNAGAGNAERD